MNTRQKLGVFLALGAALAWLLKNEIAGAVMSAVNVASQYGRAFLKSLEGFSAIPYADAAGMSIGYGHYLQPGETVPSTITVMEAEEIFGRDVGRVEVAVRSAVIVPLTQNQFDALVSFAYNVGTNAFKNSTLLKRLNAGDYAGAANEFGRWIYTTTPDGRKIVAGALVERRAREQALFLA
jgi:lysozyme